MVVNQGIATAQADTLHTWAEQWGRDEAPGSGEIAFLLNRAARMMVGADFSDLIQLKPACISTEVAPE